MRTHAGVTMCLALLIAAVVCVPGGASAPASTFQIVFESDRDGDVDLRLVGSDGTRDRPLTATSTPEGAPSWSPDGTTVVYACAPDRNWDICTIDVSTREVQQLTHTPTDEFDPRYTPDGTQIVLETYPAGRVADIAIMPASGGVPRPLTSTPRVDDQDPTPDPNSTRIAFESGASIVLADVLEPGRITPVTSGSAGDSDPFFSSRDEIVFTRRVGRSQDVLVAGAANPDGRRPLRKLTSGTTNDVEPAWTADGTQVVFTRTAKGGVGSRIFVMGAEGEGRRAVTKGGRYDDRAPAAQPVAAASALVDAPRATLRITSTSCGSGFTTYIGTNAANTKHGTGARDCMFGRGGADRLYGAGGRDVLVGEGGADSLYGESGNDRIYAQDGQKDKKLDGGSGADWAEIDAGLDNAVYISTVVP